MVYHSASTSSYKELEQGLAEPSISQLSKHKHQDSFYSITGEPSDIESEEQLGIAIRAYYRQPRRLGFDRADDGHEEVLERSRKYNETERMYLDRRLRNLTRYGTLPDLVTLFGNWKRGSSVHNLPDTSSIYYDAEEFSAINASQADDYGDQRRYPGSQNFEDAQDETFIEDILNLERQIRSLPQPRHQSDHEHSLGFVTGDQDLGLQHSYCTT